MEVAGGSDYVFSFFARALSKKTFLQVPDAIDDVRIFHLIIRRLPQAVASFRTILHSSYSYLVTSYNPLVVVCRKFTFPPNVLVTFQ